MAMFGGAFDIHPKSKGEPSSASPQSQGLPPRKHPALLVDPDTYLECIRELETRPRRPTPVFYSHRDEDPTNQHFQHYLDLVERSQGYYVPQVPEGVKVAATRPRTVPTSEFDDLEEAARDALNWYNEENKGYVTYELVKVECGSCISLGSGLMYLVAFIARGSVSCVEIPFRAKVRYGVLGKCIVESCEMVAESCAKFTRLNGRCC